jgi:futalosine hydrolase
MRKVKNMTKILIVSATNNEVKFLDKFDLIRNEKNNNFFKFQLGGNTIDLLITGVGMIATTFELTRHLSLNTYDIILNIGIAGAFDKSIPLGEVVQVNNDCFVELGAIDDDKFISIFELGLLDKNEFPFSNGILKNDFEANFLSAYKPVNGITVNKVNGNENEIQKLKNTLMQNGYKPKTESMEGAAFLYTCFQFKTPCVQVRAISNYIEKRDKSTWKIKDALNNLEKATLTLLEQLLVFNN